MLFIVNAKWDDIPGCVCEAKAFFVDSRRVVEKMKLEKMTFMGHSLRAYVSMAYTLKYPMRVSRLMLLSPAGVPRDPVQQVSCEQSPHALE